MTENFYDIAKILDRLKKVEHPTEADLQELTRYISEEQYARYFFNDLNNPAWVEPLHKIGWFSKAPPPLEDKNQPGYFSMPIWHEGEYLNRLATSIPNIIRDVALVLETDNSRAIRTMFEALLKTPPNVVAETVNQFKKWLSTPFARFMMLSHELGDVMEYLAKGGQVGEALIVLEILLEPIQLKDRFEEGRLVASSSHDAYWLNEALKNNLPALRNITPTGVINVAEKQLLQAIDLEHDPKVDEGFKKLNSYWRLSISPQADVHQENEIKDMLVNTIIKGLDTACEQGIDETPQILSNYISSEYSIFRRIANYTLRKWGGQYKDLLLEAYRKNKDVPIKGLQTEFEWLIQTQFPNLPNEIQETEVRIRLEPDPKYVDELLQTRGDRFTGSSPDEKRRTIVERLQLEELSPIGDYLDEETKKHYEYLKSKHGEPLPRPESGVVISSWEGPESPIEKEQLGKKPVDAVVKDLLSFIPTDRDSFGVPSREGLARTLEADVQARAVEYAKGSELFINSELPFVYHTHLLRGLENAVKNREKLELKNIITVCEYITSQERDKFQRQDYEEGLPAAKLAVLHFLEEVFSKTEPYFDDEVLDKSGKIITDLLYQPEPFPDNEEVQGYDAATHSLNSLHGVGMHSLVAFGLYRERKRKKEKGDAKNPVMVPLVKEILTDKLDKTKYPSLSVHSVYGWYYPQFMYLDKKWALDNQERIFPAGAKLQRYWQAAWSAYVQFSDVYREVFPALISQYQRAFSELPILEKKPQYDRTDEKIGTHVLKAYLLNLINFDSGDGLLKMYYEKASDDTRSNGNFWLSHVLESQKPSANDQTWKKLWNLWQRRVQEATEAGDQTSYAKEIANFSRLLKSVPVDLKQVYPTLQQMLDFKFKGFEVQLIVEYLGKNCEKYPDLAISMLHEIVISDQILYLTSDIEKSVENILLSSINASREAKVKAIEIINTFGERGDYRWRPLLEKIGQVA